MKLDEILDWKLPVFKGICPSTVDWARMAAYIDGEGSILINTRKSTAHATDASGFYLRVTVTNTDVRLMAWLMETFGGSFHDNNPEKYYEGKNWKKAYWWGASSQKGAWILFNCLPYFIIKRDQAELGIQLQESLNEIGRMRHKCLPTEVVEYRRQIKKKLLVFKAKGRQAQIAAEEQLDSAGACAPVAS
jgi:hypothetical protein